MSVKPTLMQANPTRFTRHNSINVSLFTFSLVRERNGGEEGEGGSTGKERNGKEREGRREGKEGQGERKEGRKMLLGREDRRE
jgi:hypothetical protein